MNYRFLEDDRPLIERICQLNGISAADLDLSAFFNVPILPIVETFKEKLSEYQDKRFLIVGDYDCDGICATVIIKRLLESLHIACNHFIPSRFKQGYGLNEQIVRNAYDNAFDVIFCVDNGSVACDALALAKELGLKVFIIDHHEYADAPEAEAFLHPDLFPQEYRDMCAAGLCCLLSDSFHEDELSEVYGGLATIADMVRVLGYNRFLIKRMYEILKTKDILPIRYLLGDASLDYEQLSYTVIPKINAVSRLEELMNVNYMVHYLKDNDASCMKYLKYIENINTIRKEDTKKMYAYAKKQIDPDQPFLLLKSDTFKEGLCGLLANRMMNEYQKPVLVLSEKEGELKGSGRSPDGFDLYTYLKAFSGLFTAFGGHEQAVGLSLPLEAYDALTDAIAKNPFLLKDKDMDVLVTDPDKVDLEMLSQLEGLRPFGTAFKEPLFAFKDVEYRNCFLIAQKYPKYVLTRQLEAISFHSDHINKQFTTMIGRIQRDSYHKNHIRFVIEDLL